jgi:hypothetical protein
VLKIWLGGREVLRVHEPNLLLDALIDEAGMSHDGLAARVNRLGERYGLTLLYDHASVRRWIRDHTIPRGQVPELVCEVLSERLGRSVSIADVGMSGAGRQSPDGTSLPQEMDRATAMWRGDLKQVTALRNAELLRGPAAIAPVFEWENPPDDCDVARLYVPRLNDATLSHFRVARLRYERMYRQVGGVPIRPRVVTFLNERAAPLIKSAYDNATGREMYRAVGGLVALAGVCAYDANLQGIAQRYFFQALRMAKASGDRGFGGYVVALLANQAFYLGSFRHVVQYGETALRGAGRWLTPAIVTDLSTLQAKAYARMGDRAGCHVSMRRSEEMVTRIRMADELPEADYAVQAGHVEVQHAEALRSLGDMAAAGGYAQRATAIAGGSHARGQVHRYATLAMILAGERDADAAADVAGKMLDLAVGMESGRVYDRVRAVRDAIIAHADGAVAHELSDRVQDVIGSTEAKR